MKPKAVEIINEVGIASGGENIDEDLPANYPVNALSITQTVTQDTDEASLSELLAGIGDIKIETTDGFPVKTNATDLYYLNRDLLGKQPYYNLKGTGTDNAIRYITVLLPLNPKIREDPFNMEMGIAPETAGRLKISTGSDTDAGGDNRTLTVTALGIQNAPKPAGFMGMYQDTFTTSVGDNFRDTQKSKVTDFMGIYAKATTGTEDITTTDALGIEALGWGLSQDVIEAINTQDLQALNNDIYQPEINGKYALMDLGVKYGQGIGKPADLKAYVESGVSESVSIYPLLKVKNL